MSDTVPCDVAAKEHADCSVILFGLTMRERELLEHGFHAGANWLKKQVQDPTLEQTAAALRRTATMIQALRSIANSSCCGCCQEAKLVARNALMAVGLKP